MWSSRLGAINSYRGTLIKTPPMLLYTLAMCSLPSELAIERLGVCRFYHMAGKL